MNNISTADLRSGLVIHWDKYFLVLISLLVLLSPFFNGSNSPEGKLVSESLLWLLAVVVFLKFIRDGDWQIYHTPFERFGLLFFIFALISAVFSVFAVDAWLAVGRILLAGIMFHFTFSLVKEERGLIKAIIFIVIISGLVQALFSFHQFFFTQWYAEVFPGFYEANLRPNIRGGVLRTIGGFINPNYLAAWLNVSLALSVSYLLFRKKRLVSRIISAVMSLLLAGGVLLSGSKGGLIVMVLTLGALAFMKDRRIIWLVIIIVVLVAIVPNPVRDGFIRAITADPYISMRPGIWLSAASLAVEHPLIGVGPDNYRYMGHLHAPATDFLLVHYSRSPRIAHNSLLHSFAEYGFLGFMPLLLLIIYLLWLSLKEVLRKQEGKERDYCLAGIAIAFTGVFVHSMLDNVMNHRALMVVLVLLAAVMLVNLRQRKTRLHRLFSNVGKLKIPPIRKHLVVITVFLALIGFYYYQVIKPYFYEMEMAAISENMETTLQGVKSTEGKESEVEALKSVLTQLGRENQGNLAVWRNLAFLERKLFIQSGILDHYLAAERYYQRAINNLKGKSYSDLYGQVTMLFELVKKGYPKTEEILKEMREKARLAIRANPKRAIYYQAAATIEREAGHYNEARRLLQIATSIEPNYIRAWSELAKLARLRGDAREYKRLEAEINNCLERISKGIKPADDDIYGWQIISINNP